MVKNFEEKCKFALSNGQCASPINKKQKNCNEIPIEWCYYKQPKNGVVVIREDGKFNFEFMTDSEMCYLLEQLIEEINRRKAGAVDVGFWDKAGNYVEDRQPVQNAVVDLGITVHGGIKTADVTVEVEGKENE